MDVIIVRISVAGEWHIIGVFSSNVPAEDIAEYGEYWKKRLNGNHICISTWAVREEAKCV